MADQAQQTPRTPGDPGIWIFICADMIAFAALFGVHLYTRSLDVEPFRVSGEQTGVLLGTLNTVLLLTSSWFVACGLNRVRAADKPAAGFFWGALACGLLFCTVKVFEWSAILNQGVALDENGFWASYFVLTGVHLYHVLAGLGALTFLALRATKKKPEDLSVETFESGAVYWHMVDFLWIIIFVLFYMVI